MAQVFMMLDMDFSHVLLFFGHNIPIISFLGAIIGGEETLLFLSILAASGHLPLWEMITFFFVGIIISDSLWFLIGRSKSFDWVIKRKFTSKVYSRWGRLVEKATDGNNFHALMVTKFLYGFRVATIMYISREGLEFLWFLFYTIIVDAIWTAALTTIGWFAGKGISVAASFGENIVLFMILLGLTLFIGSFGLRKLSQATKTWLLKGKKT